MDITFLRKFCKIIIFKKFPDLEQYIFRLSTYYAKKSFICHFKKFIHFSVKKNFIFQIKILFFRLNKNYSIFYLKKFIFIFSIKKMTYFSIDFFKYIFLSILITEKIHRWIFSFFYIFMSFIYFVNQNMILFIEFERIHFNN